MKYLHAIQILEYAHKNFKITMIKIFKDVKMEKIFLKMQNFTKILEQKKIKQKT